MWTFIVYNCFCIFKVKFVCQALDYFLFGIFYSLGYTYKISEKSITNYYIIEFIVYNFNCYCFQRSANFGQMLVQFASKPRRSIVRKIGSQLTWIHAQRLHILWKENSSEAVSCYSDNVELPTEWVSVSLLC